MHDPEPIPAKEWHKRHEQRLQDMERRAAEGADLYTGESMGPQTPYAEFDTEPRGMGMAEYKRRERLRKRKLHQQRKREKGGE